MADVEEAEIPSDAESNDDIENSEDEISVNENNFLEDLESPNNEIEEATDSSIESDKDDDTPLDGIWTKKRQSYFNPPFTEFCGPKNIPENITKPGEFFLCLFSEQNIDMIVEQSNLYCNQREKRKKF